MSLTAQPQQSMTPIGVYVHFPWCLSKCPYCDFVSFAATQDKIDHTGYADAVLAELDQRGEFLEGRELRSVFFGGGTPSLWNPAELGRVIQAVLRAAGRSTADVEITVECNPSSLDEDRARALVDAGVNRLSVGVQGLDTERLRYLGRLHGAEGGLEAVRAAVRSSVPRVSADLMYGVATPGPGSPAGRWLAGGPIRQQTPAGAADEARRLLETGVTHLSAYSLTIEPGTRFGELDRQRSLPVASEDTVADAFFAIEEAVESAGLRHYEISNYARPGDEAQHNLGYWLGHDYLGLGCAAFGTLSERPPGGQKGTALRYRNTPDPARYMAAARSGEPTGQTEERLDAETRLRERIMLGLRLREGVDLSAAERELGIAVWTEPRRRAARKLMEQGKLLVQDGRLRITPKAWVFADGVAAELF
jgi:oxygen-independent coproporphyrinogen-3 oxidase